MKIVGHLMRVVILLTVASIVHAENPALPHLTVVPLPVKIKPLPGTFTLDNQTRIVAVDKEARRPLQRFLAQQPRLPSGNRDYSAQEGTIYVLHPRRRSKFACRRVPVSSDPTRNSSCGAAVRVVLRHSDPDATAAVRCRTPWRACGG